MTKNIGSKEKMARFTIAAILVATFFLVPLHGVIGYVALAVAALALITGSINFCPLWTVLGINTNKK